MEEFLILKKSDWVRNLQKMAVKAHSGHDILDEDMIDCLWEEYTYQMRQNNGGALVIKAAG